MAETVGKEGFINQVKCLLSRPDSTPDLPTITVPTLVLTGADDAVCTPPIHETMAAAIPDAELRIVPQCGHLSTLEQPETLNSALHSWLAHLG
ncbi:MAG: alpha/beta hydrolase [Chloroflexota bacterium]